MKNIQIIDGSDNCTYSVYAVTDDEFRFIFPDDGQDIEFIEDIIQREGEEKTSNIMTPIWDRYIEKIHVNGINGTLFYDLLGKKQYYPTKKDIEMVTPFGTRYWRE